MKIKQSSVLVLLFSLFVLLISKTSKATMAADSSSSEAKVHIVYTERPKEGSDPDAFHLQTLTSVLGSEESAKGALLYTYKHATCGFSAKLTPQQVAELSKQPGVLQVVPSQTVQLHSGPGRINI